MRGKTLKYVSRGGLKLEKAMDNFGLRLDDKICMDVGAGRNDSRSGIDRAEKRQIKGEIEA